MNYDESKNSKLIPEYKIGDKVKINWDRRGHRYYATITGIDIDEKNSKITYSVIYDKQNEIENDIPESWIQSRITSPKKRLVYFLFEKKVSILQVAYFFPFIFLNH